MRAQIGLEKELAVNEPARIKRSSRLRSQAVHRSAAESLAVGADRDHGHDPAGCDRIICWEHDWPD
jgi:hypothetical protein